MENQTHSHKTRVLVVGDIVDSSSVNFDPLKAIGRIRGVCTDGSGNYIIEYPDGSTGVFVQTKNTQFLNDSMYKKYVEDIRPEVEKSTELSMSKVIHKINHWIKKKKSHNSAEKKQGVPVMEKPNTSAQKLIDVIEGFADVLPSPIPHEGDSGGLWIPMKRPPEGLKDLKGKVVPTNRPMAINALQSTKRFSQVGIVEGGKVTSTFNVSTEDLINSGVALK